MAKSIAWYRSGWTVLVTSLLLPPLGLVLLWLRPTRMRRKVLGSISIAAVGVTYLVVFFGLRLEADGTGIPRVLRFHRPEAHYAKLEQSRAAQQLAAAATAPAGQPVPATPSAPAAREPAVLAKPLPPWMTSTYWTDFRGPRRDGHYDEMEILTVWPAEGLKPLWRQPIGGGYASFVIAQGRAFTIEQRRNREVVAAYDVATGRELWTHSWEAEFRETMGGDGPRATPTWHEGRVYALGATGELHVLDAETGKLFWSRNILRDNGADNLSWGMAAAPLVVDDKVLVLPGGFSGASVVAYHKRSGEPVWKSLNDQQAYTSPVVVTLAGHRQLLIVSGRHVMGVTIEDGKLLWSFPWATQYGINCAQPVLVDENHVFVSAGYGHGAALLAITRSAASGSNGASEKWTVRSVWENTNMKNKFNSSVLHRGYIYGLDEGILACIDARTGERKWKGGRYGYGQVLLASGHLIITTEGGDLVLVRATPERHEELARFSAIEGKTWNHPAIAGGLLLVRNAREMAAFQLSR